MPPPSRRGRQRKGEGTPVIQAALVEAQRGASNRKDQGCAVSDAHTSQIFGARVATSSLCTRASAAGKAGKVCSCTVAGLFPLPTPTVSCTRHKAYAVGLNCSEYAKRVQKRFPVDRLGISSSLDQKLSLSPTQVLPLGCPYR